MQAAYHVALTSHRHDCPRPPLPNDSPGQLPASGDEDRDPVLPRNSQHPVERHLGEAAGNQEQQLSLTHLSAPHHRERVIYLDRGVLHPITPAEAGSHLGSQPHQAQERAPLPELLRQQGALELVREKEQTPPDPYQGAGQQQPGPENDRSPMVKRTEPGREQKQAQRHDSEQNDQGGGRPGKEEGRWRVVVARIGKGPAIPLVPLVSESAIHVDVNQLSAGMLSHRPEDSYLRAMLPLPVLRGIYRTDQRARAAYSEAAGIYRIMPRAVCLPADVSDLQRLVCWAAEHRVPLIPRGAGSAMGGGNVGDGVVVDLTRMTGQRFDLQPLKRRALTGTVVTLGDLNAAAAHAGLRLPPDPSSARWATLGGMVATNAAGARSVRYGSVRRWVEALAMITADGELLTLRRGVPPDGGTAVLARFERDAAPAIQEAELQIRSRFPRTRKNSSGYALDAFLSSGDLLDLVIGAEGTLGIVTEIEWRLDPIPPCRGGLRVALGSLDLLSYAVDTLAFCRPSAVELLDRTFLDLVSADRIAGAGLRFPGAQAVLLVELERDDEASLRAALEEATARVRPLGQAVDTAFSPVAAERLWAIRHAASPILAGLPEGRRSLQVVEDACVPLDRMGEYIAAVRTAAGSRDIPVVMFGHAGDGHVHVNLLPEVSRPGWEEQVAGLLAEVTAVVIELGGTPSGEHGDGRLRGHALGRLYGDEIVELFRRLKSSFDPNGIFNPGVILPGTEPPISRLKVGEGAVSLPEDIERGLREIEVSGGYSRSRLELAD